MTMTMTLIGLTMASALTLSVAGPAHAAQGLANRVRNAIAGQAVTVGAGTVDGVRQVAAHTVRIDMKTAKLTLPKGKDGYSIYQATATKGARGVTVTNVRDVGALALAAVAKTPGAAGQTLIIGDATGKDLGEMTGKGIRVGILHAGKDGRAVGAHNAIVILRADGQPARIIADGAAKRAK